jgi:hypothetical protein
VNRQIGVKIDQVGFPGKDFYIFPTGLAIKIETQKQTTPGKGRGFEKLSPVLIYF